MTGSEESRSRIVRYWCMALLELLTAPVRVPLIALYPDLVCRIWGHDWTKLLWNIEVEEEPVYYCWVCDAERMDDSVETQTPAERYQEAKRDV